MDPTFWVALFACISTVVVGFLNYNTAKAAKVQVQEVHDFVNSKDKVNTETIASLRAEITALQEDRLARADAAVPTGAHEASSPVPTSVVIVDTEKPIEVDVVSKKKP